MYRERSSLRAQAKRTRDTPRKRVESDDDVDRPLGNWATGTFVQFVSGVTFGNGVLHRQDRKLRF